MLKIWGRKNSSNVRKPLWAAEELGLAEAQQSPRGLPGAARLLARAWQMVNAPRVREQADRLQALIMDLLSLARIESGREVLEFGEVAIGGSTTQTVTITNSATATMM